MPEPDSIRESFAAIPINRLLGLRLESRTAAGAVVAMEIRPDFEQEMGVVHGGIVTAIADTAAVYAFIPDLDDDLTMASIELKLNFLRPAFLDRGEVVARSKVLRRGAQVGVCEVEVTQGDELLGKGLFTYLFFRRDDRG